MAREPAVILASTFSPFETSGPHVALRRVDRRWFVKPKTPTAEAARRRIRHAQDQADAPRGFAALAWQSDPTRWLQLVERDAGDGEEAPSNGDEAETAHREELAGRPA
jgi:hypothetical protein